MTTALFALLDDLRDTTFTLLKERAEQGNLEVEKLGLRPSEITDDTFFFVVWFDDFLDEHFLANTLYEVNIADWLAEDCRREARVQHVQQWRIEVRRTGSPMEIHYSADSDPYDSPETLVIRHLLK